jgi:16S rRNA (uracil1498-N3)-methyltransferase
MSHRFFVETSIIGEQCRLTDAESHHLTRVMRAQLGDEITLFDGSGDQFRGRIEQIAKDHVDLVIVGRETINRELPLPLTLAVALPKGDRQKLLIEKLVELGVTQLIPLITQRGVAQPVDTARDRLCRGVIEASKQCGRNRLMTITEARSVSELIASTANIAIRIVGDPHGDPISDVRAGSGDLIAAVGPEGGFTDEELAIFDKAHWDRIAMGPRILRIETAAIAIAAWVSLR